MIDARRLAILATAAAGLALTACSGGGDEAPVETNVVNVFEPENAAPVENIVEPAPLPSPSATPSPVEASPTPDFSDAEQMQQDADATGMTSRVNRDGEDTQPAE